ncbi:hypothetical protein CBS115989_10839 [Aspergillus niger]|uniref:Contig An11c0340, genomic contig n=3 Tax=Aspergillus niger TaxID=5061 RepID=A5ABQ1_ASPNC|nr:uncharacterized protein BO96DRAFT_438791 [Aspergillus niger CBS 101883]XP_059606398.1 uncharacterized protein An11g10010 [Aspergillus niger]RDH17413.1 hypothetical protein M747DRAFT_356352 [Aspergillus niger ATCC 13496]KAI2812042.1 hypothetical protein CBS115989_10839 [Aspergillus niger]KAI2847549.1 hypothetical protein CBS11350_3075 [Aspergillus niger]KAI2847702.1 hypothetical protein CBS11232_7047 [Aspergillus niger]KAI2872847.1 hypothetical protein CBS115988_7439 [Aspergillus niger]
MEFYFLPVRKHFGPRKPKKPFVYAKGEAPFEKLLPELWWEVVTYLPTNEMLALRLISKEMEGKIYTLAFKLILPHLPTLHTKLTRSSIQKIHTIASNPELCHIPRAMRVVYPWRYLCPGEKLSAKSEFMQLSLKLPEIHTLMNDLKYSLTNCRSFEICIEATVTQIQAESEYINILLQILAEADINPEQLTFSVPPDRAKILVGASSSNDRLFFHIKEPCNMIRGWTNLHTLKIVDDETIRCGEAVEPAVCQILKEAPCLERLIFSESCKSPVRNRNSLSPLSKAGPFPRLKHLELHSVAVHSEDLLRLLRVNGRYLVSVGFFDCWCHTPVRWEALLWLMKDYMPRLNSFTLQQCGIDRSSRPYTYTYEGPDIGDILGKLRFSLRGLYF